MRVRPDSGACRQPQRRMLCGIVRARRLHGQWRGNRSAASSQPSGRRKAIASPIDVGNFLRRRQQSPRPVTASRSRGRSRGLGRGVVQARCGLRRKAMQRPPSRRPVAERRLTRLDLRSLRKPSEKLRDGLWQAPDRSTRVRDTARSERRRWSSAAVSGRGMGAVPPAGAVAHRCVRPIFAARGVVRIQAGTRQHGRPGAPPTRTGARSGARRSGPQPSCRGDVPLDSRYLSTGGVHR